MTMRLAWTGIGMTVASIATSVTLGRFEYYDATVHTALAFALCVGCILALGAGVVLVLGARQRRRRQDV